MTKITNIEEVYNVEGNNWGAMDGYRISTEDKEYFILINSSQSCCESWGYFTSEDDIQEYIGSELIKVELVDEAYNKEKLDEHVGWGLDCGGIVFVNFETSNGTLQFAAYNAHNGYYGHDAVVKVVSNGESELLFDGYL